LNVSKGFQAAYKFDSNDQFVLWGTGEYTGSNQYRNKDAVYFLPSIDEFYKAAYYDPHKNNGAGGYWKYATASDTTPLPTSGGTDPYTAVWQCIDRVDVKNAGGLSAYGTMAQNGNYSEWIETAFDGTNDNPSEIRNLTSGNWSNVHDAMGKDNRDVHNPAVWDSMYINFRVASVPEPSALSLLAIGLSALAMMRRRRNIVVAMAILSMFLFGQEANATNLYEIVDPNLSHQLVTIKNNSSAPYAFKISLNTTTLNDWLVFLNSKAQTSDPYNLFKASDFSRSSSNGIFTHSLLNVSAGNNPVRGINLYDAYRYANWVENGANSYADTETGTYNLHSLNFSMGEVTVRDSNAKYFIQSTSEWLNALGIINTDNNYYEWSDTTGYYATTAQFMYPNALNHDGTYSPAVYADGPGRGAGFNNVDISFRIGSVPEPSAVSLLAVGLSGLAMMRRRRS
jgi:hypothetical protein